MRVGIIGDTHAPFTHPRYIDFVSDIFDSWDVGAVVHIGDVVDHHRLSFHDQDPSSHGAEEEADRASEIVSAWSRRFPDVKVCIGNHDERHFRVARKAGMPDRYVRNYADLWGTPSWSWSLTHSIDGVTYEHGSGSSGKYPAITRAINKRTSVAIGHCHTVGGVNWHTNESSRIFGLSVGCGIDIGAYAFAYQIIHPIRPILGCGIVIDGEFAYFEPMQCERYRR